MEVLSPAHITAIRDAISKLDRTQVQNIAVSFETLLGLLDAYEWAREKGYEHAS